MPPNVDHEELKVQEALKLMKENPRMKAAEAARQTRASYECLRSFTGPTINICECPAKSRGQCGHRSSCHTQPDLCKSLVNHPQDKHFSVFSRVRFNLLLVNQQMHAETRGLFAEKPIIICSPECFENFVKYMAGGSVRHHWVRRINVYLHNFLDGVDKAVRPW
jgi:hypothetical protein